jgi:hypothetical protein
MATATRPTHANVVAALAAVMDELPAIGKGDRSPEGYQYRGIEAITKHLQPLLAKHCIVITPSATIVDVRPSLAMKEGWQDVQITVDWRIYGPGGRDDYLEARTSGIGRDKSDKGSNKAQTQAYKYLLLHMLSIADKDDDADGVTYEHERADVPAAAPISDKSLALFDRVKATKGTPVADTLKEFATESGLQLTARAFDGDQIYAEQVTLILESASA